MSSPKLNRLGKVEVVDLFHSAPVTEWLTKWSQGDESALEKATPYVYEELKRLARGYLRNERSDHTLQATALVHEAYLRIQNVTGIEWKHRGQFVAVAAQMMRRILVDYARKHSAEKRGGGELKLSLSRADRVAMPHDLDLVALDEALKSFAIEYPRQAQVVELLFFGGLSTQETADVLSNGGNISQRTVERDWGFARSWLLREITRD
jgi:RNA polymerase sigma factor (TIGR02999 family)